ncbi:hypothetical protein QYE76_023937 [Lolium multiflorum]|uniref:Uncharacterized protein n=1 Tax=Lolium multiflorum TaxID=4521 RepID=A0AAD8RBI1_LOLMU|nr:hypothetical protein QYE76_023937 [Lolium multiflorum]
MKKDTGICSDDIIRTFISRRVLPLKRRAHRMSEMYGPGDPTKITGLPLSKKDVVLKAKQICQTAMRFNWKWGLLPSALLTLRPKKTASLIEAERRGACRKRARLLRPDPLIFWKDLKMGKTPASRLGRSPPKPTGSADDLEVLEIHEHVPPLRAEAGTEFVDKLMAQGQKNKRSPSDDGSSHPSLQALPDEELGRRKLAARYARKQMPTASGSAQDPRALKVPQGPQPLLTQARHHLVPVTSLPPSGGTKFGACGLHLLDHRTEEDPSFFLENQDTGTSNIGAGEEKLPGRRSLQLLLSLRKRQVPRRNPPRREAPTRVVRLPLPLLREQSLCRRQVLPAPSLPGLLLPRRRPRPPSLPRERRRLPAPLLRPAAPGSGASHALRPEVERRGYHSGDPRLGKDRQPAPDPIGNRSSEEHFTRLRCAVKELDSSWYDATNNLMLTADARKTLFEELLWEHRELVEAHDKCQVLPEASIDALKEQLANAQREKEQLIKQHQEELGAQKTYWRAQVPACPAGS